MDIKKIQALALEYDVTIDLEIRKFIVKVVISSQVDVVSFMFDGHDEKLILDKIETLSKQVKQASDEYYAARMLEIDQRIKEAAKFLPENLFE